MNYCDFSKRRKWFSRVFDSFYMIRLVNQTDEPLYYEAYESFPVPMRDLQMASLGASRRATISEEALSLSRIETLRPVDTISSTNFSNRGRRVASGPLAPQCRTSVFPSSPNIEICVTHYYDRSVVVRRVLPVRYYSSLTILW